MWKVYFNLNKPSPVEANSEINGIKLAVNRDSAQLVAELVEACDNADAQQKALPIANQFLGKLCWKYHTCLSIDIATQHVEHTNPAGQKQASITIGDGPIDVSERVILVKKDSSGNVLEVSDSSKLGTIEVKSSEAASYYYHAHLSDDPFNKFRDLYLAAENVASKIQATKGLSQKEVKRLSESGKSYEEGLLKLALDECFASNPLSLKKAAKNLPEFDDSQEVIAQVAKTLYNGYRCQLNHSKASENKKTPFNPQDEKEVRAALPLTEFVAKSLLQYEDNSLL